MHAVSSMDSLLLSGSVTPSALTPRLGASADRPAQPRWEICQQPIPFLHLQAGAPIHSATRLLVSLGSSAGRTKTNVEGAILQSSSDGNSSKTTSKNNEWTQKEWEATAERLHEALITHRYSLKAHSKKETDAASGIPAQTRLQRMVEHAAAEGSLVVPYGSCVEYFVGEGIDGLSSDDENGKDSKAVGEGVKKIEREPHLRVRRAKTLQSDGTEQQHLSDLISMFEENLKPSSSEKGKKPKHSAALPPQAAVGTAAVQPIGDYDALLALDKIEWLNDILHDDFMAVEQSEEEYLASKKRAADREARRAALQACPSAALEFIEVPPTADQVDIKDKPQAVRKYDLPSAENTKTSVKPAGGAGAGGSSSGDKISATDSKPPKPVAGGKRPPVAPKRTQHAKKASTKLGDAAQADITEELLAGTTRSEDAVSAAASESPSMTPGVTPRQQQQSTQDTIIFPPFETTGLSLFTHVRQLSPGVRQKYVEIARSGTAFTSDSRSDSSATIPHPKLAFIKFFASADMSWKWPPPTLPVGSLTPPNSPTSIARPAAATSAPQPSKSGNHRYSLPVGALEKEDDLTQNASPPRQVMYGASSTDEDIDDELAADNISVSQMSKETDRRGSTASPVPPLSGRESTRRSSVTPRGGSPANADTAGDKERRDDPYASASGGGKVIHVKRKKKEKKPKHHRATVADMVIGVTRSAAEGEVEWERPPTPPRIIPPLSSFTFHPSALTKKLRALADEEMSKRIQDRETKRNAIVDFETLEAITCGPVGDDFQPIEVMDSSWLSCDDDEEDLELRPPTNLPFSDDSIGDLRVTTAEASSKGRLKQLSEVRWSPLPDGELSRTSLALQKLQRLRTPASRQGARGPSPLTTLAHLEDTLSQSLGPITVEESLALHRDGPYFPHFLPRPSTRQQRMGGGSPTAQSHLSSSAMIALQRLQSGAATPGPSGRLNTTASQRLQRSPPRPNTVASIGPNSPPPQLYQTTALRLANSRRQPHGTPISPTNVERQVLPAVAAVRQPVSSTKGERPFHDQSRSIFRNSRAQPIEGLRPLLSRESRSRGGKRKEGALPGPQEVAEAQRRLLRAMAAQQWDEIQKV